MDKSLEELALEINHSDNKMIFLSGQFEEFLGFNLANDFNYSYLDFESFLQENQIDSNLFDGTDRETHIRISIDQWTQRMAYKEQKDTIIIDGFNLKRVNTLLTKSLLNQELMHLSKNNAKLKTNLVFIVDTTNSPLDKQILPKILEYSKVISC
ncbi:MAG: hypothetical protein ACFFDW_09695 [Candidatus Thorarchaeota archaeon]